MTKIDDTQKNGYAEPEIAVTATAIPQQSYDAAAPTGAAASGDTGGPPIPAGHSRYYCSKCHTVRTFVRVVYNT